MPQAPIDALGRGAGLGSAGPAGATGARRALGDIGLRWAAAGFVCDPHPAAVARIIREHASGTWVSEL